MHHVVIIKQTHQLAMLLFLQVWVLQKLTYCIKQYVSAVLLQCDDVSGIAGVYHIGDHFIHESGRGIEDLSSMARAMRGSKYFDRFSPTHILRSVQQPASIRLVSESYM